MKLYKIDYDGQGDFVEAGSVSQAIEVWHQNLWSQNPSTWTRKEEPESVTLVNSDPVMRSLEGAELVRGWCRVCTAPYNEERACSHTMDPANCVARRAAVAAT